MNKIGVSLAADSAVTIGGGTGKIYTSADKLFQLSVKYPVGAMIYGSSSLNGIPWETIVKIYRRNLGDKSFNTIEEYAQDLISYLDKNNDLFSKKSQTDITKFLTTSLYGWIRQDVYDELKKVEIANKKITDDEIKKAIFSNIKKWKEIISKWERPPSIKAAIIKSVSQKLNKMIHSVKKDVFQKLPMTSSCGRMLTSLAIQALTRCFQDDYETGLVVAGFGEKEFYPSLVPINIDGLIEGNLKYKMSETRSINHLRSASVMAFAQSEMVHTFMQGIDPRISQKIIDDTESLFFGISDVIIKKVEDLDENLGEKLRKEVWKELPNILTRVKGEWDSLCRDLHWGPVTEIVSSLPKDELAAMAESLVNLTKFRRRVSTDKETVGGPIDVAVITKGDGFIWVRRKHYFDSKLNPRKMSRFTKEIL
jgi:hypothetical protein